MAKFLNLITLFILTMCHFSFIFCQLHLEPALKYRAKKSGSGRHHIQRKTSDLTDMYTNEFLKAIEARMEGHPTIKGQESKVSHQWKTAVETHPKNKRLQRKQTGDENMPEKTVKTGRKGQKKEKESEEDEDNDPTSRQTVEVKKIHLRKGRHTRHSEKSEGKNPEQKKPESQQQCNEKCFTPKCEVECMGDQASAACSAPGCRALTRGDDSASLCSGESCQALCFKEECISGCEGIICFVKCHGKKCHAVAEGSEAGSMCVKDGCMAYGNGNGTKIKCEGESCQAQCIGENCSAECNGTNCVAGCTGKNCQATCVGKNCQQLKQVGEVAVDLGKRSSEEKSMNDKNKGSLDDDGYYGNKYFIEKKTPGNSDSDIANKGRTEAPKVMGKKANYNSNESQDKVRLDYTVDIQLTPSLVWYIRDKIYQLKKVAGYMQYLRWRQ